MWQRSPALQAQVIELQNKVAQTDTLAALVDFSRSNPTNTYKAAAVIGRDPSPFLRYVIINRGSNDGIRRGMPVVTNQGLVGRVDAVIGGASRVQLITDPSSIVSVFLQNSEADAIMNGSVSGELTLDMLSQDVQVQTGDVVLTSGLGGEYPPDLLIGQVGNIRKRESDLFQEATVQPVVDFSRLEIVLVIVNFRPIDITPLVPINRRDQKPACLSNSGAGGDPPNRRCRQNAVIIRFSRFDAGCSCGMGASGTS